LTKIEKEYEVNPEEDLNKLDTDELERKKAIMDVNFNKSKVRPGDPNFEYDKRVDFIPDKPSEWDINDSEECIFKPIPILDEEVNEKLPRTEELVLDELHSIENTENFEDDEAIDSLEDKDPKLNVKFDIKDLENELRVDDVDDFWS